jgi:hypothetical protein
MKMKKENLNGERNKTLTLILLTWTKWRAPTSASKWRIGFNSAFKGLKAKENWDYKKFDK